MCFGDSNTWGYNVDTGKRFPYEKRWTSLLQKELGPGYNIIPEGLNGRTAVTDDPFTPCRNGIEYLPMLLVTHYPLDLVVIMLGTNDCKCFFRETGFSIGKGIRALVETVQASDAGIDGEAPEVLIVSPASLSAGIVEKAPFDIREFADMDGHHPQAVSRELAAELRRQADELGCGFMDADGFAAVSSIDGVHLTAESHAGLAAGIASKIREMGF